MAKTFRTNQNLIGGGFRQSSGDTLTLSGNTLIGNCGTFKYSTNRHNTYTSRSIVDADYVTGKTSAITSLGSNSQVIYRDLGGITGATNFTYDKTLSVVSVPNLCISITPPDDTCLDYLLSWDENFRQVRKIPYSTAAGLTCACNGVVSSGGVVCLGGDLCTNTTISGINDNSIRFCDLCGFCAIITSNNIVLDSRNCSGGLYFKSQSGIGALASNFSCAVGLVMDYQANHGFMVHDNRVGCLQSGIEYAGNYAAFYTPRSLVDKNYVDTIASGLQPHPAVRAATTENILLSGITGTVILDGITIAEGERVLIKNQTDARYNGIYYLTGDTFIRTYDFNESTESVQGAYTFVLSGATQQSTSWVLSTPNPILMETTPLTFTLFNQITDIDTGHGLCMTIDYGKHTLWVDGVSLAGNSITWDGLNFDVDITSGTLGTALSQVITGGTNGLTKVGKNLKLGGTLTENTLIDGAYTLNLCNGAQLNTQYGYQISGSTILRASTKSLTSLYFGQLAGSNCGNNNVGIGFKTLTGTTGDFNYGIGSCSLMRNTTGSMNIGIGFALVCNTSGCWNIGIGTNVLSLNTSGCMNVGIGAASLQRNTTGGRNNAMGSSTLTMNTTGDNNVAFGDSVLYDNTIGCRNTAIGANALTYNTTGCWGTSVGADSLYCNCTGSGNTAMGTRALYLNKVGCNNVALGINAGYNEIGSNKLYIANNPSCNLIYGDFSLNEVTLPKLKLCDTPSVGTLSDDVLVWNSTDKCVKTVDISTITNTVDICMLDISVYSATTSSSFIGTSGGSTIYLPNVPKLGQKVSVADVCGNALGLNIHVCSNTFNILNYQEATINTDFGSISFVFNGIFWSAVSFIN